MVNWCLSIVDRQPYTKHSSSASTSKLSTVEINLIVEHLRTQSHRDFIRMNKYSIWKAFSKFYLRLDVKPKNWEDWLTLDIGYLLDQKKAIHHHLQLHFCH